MPEPADCSVLERVYGIIESRRYGNPEISHTAKLLQKGTAKIAQKLGEEAVETLIEAVRGNNKKLVAESCDLLFHLMVLWADRGVRPAEVWSEMARREGVSGIAERAARGDDA